MHFKKLLLILAVMVMACSVMAQGGGRRGGRGFGPQGPVQLAGRPDVQADLGLSDDQKAKITDLNTSGGQERRQIFQDANGDQDAMQKGMAALNAKQETALNGILTSDQQKRLGEIRIQIDGNSSALRKEIQESLGLSDDQKSKLADLQKTSQEANTSVFAKMRSQEITREDGMAAMKKNQDALKDGIDKILTDDQKTKLKGMGGKTFTPAPPPGGGGGLF